LCEITLGEAVDSPNVKSDLLLVETVLELKVQFKAQVTQLQVRIFMKI
jgi:hypothetical protein